MTSRKSPKPLHAKAVCKGKKRRKTSTKSLKIHLTPGVEQRPPGDDGHCRADYPGWASNTEVPCSIHIGLQFEKTPERKKSFPSRFDHRNIQKLHPYTAIWRCSTAGCSLWRLWAEVCSSELGQEFLPPRPGHL